MEHDNNDNNELSGDDSDSQSKSKTRNKFNKCETLEDGAFALIHWLNSQDKNSLSEDNPIVLLKFVNDRYTILYDTDLH